MRNLQLQVHISIRPLSLYCCPDFHVVPSPLSLRVIRTAALEGDKTSRLVPDDLAIRASSCSEFRWPDLLVCHHGDGPLRRQNLQGRSFKPRFVAAKCPEVRLHGLRHTYAPPALSCGGPICVV